MTKMDEIEQEIERLEAEDCLTYGRTSSQPVA